MWFNFHTHSNYCDGKESLTNILASAEEQQLVSLGFSSHAPLPFQRAWCMKKESLSSYINEINKLKSESGIQLYTGLEVDYIPNQISPIDFPMVDYTIGSIHFVDSFEDGAGWEVDLSHQNFLDGFDKIFKHKIQDVIARYFELTREMCEKACPTIVGHLDKIKIQNTGNKFFSESESWYKDELYKTLDVIKKSGAIVEVNTRGIYLKKAETTYPSPWILEECFKRDIPITISSDAHQPKDLINYFPAAAKMISEIGYKKISVLHDGSWQSLSFNENGIKK
jgi:histidinol-phosphatase (PHP family)